jgi:prepilin-type N-terminal cleavage/methylation domain-containing protein
MKTKRGFTLIELMCVVVLMLSFMVVVLMQTRAMARSSAQATRGAGQLAQAAKFAELFRNDVRQASEAEVGPRSQTLVLCVNGETIVYRRAEGRLERVVDGEADSGPMLESIYFARAAQAGSAPPLLRARWECSADNDTVRQNPKQPAAGRMLILDTALRGLEGGTGFQPVKEHGQDARATDKPRSPQ